MKQFLESVSTGSEAGGMRTVYVHRPDSRLFCMSLCLGMGNLYEQDGERGISSLTQETLIKGTRRYTAEEVSYQAENLGASIEASSNHFTGKVRMCGPAENVRSIIKLFSEIVAAPSFPEQEVEKEKRYILSVLRSMDDDPFRAGVIRFKRAFFGDSALACPVEGRKEDLELLDQHSVRDFHNKAYRQKNCVLAVAGRFDQGEVQDLLGDGFASMPEGEALYTFPLPPSRSGMILEKKDIHDCWLVMGVPAPSMREEKGRAAFEVLNAVLGGGMYSRLFIRVREELGLSYQVGSMYVPFPGPSFLAAVAGFSPANLEKVVTIFLQEFQGLGKVDTEEFEEAKNHIIGMMLQIVERTDSLASLLAFCEHTGLGLDFPSRYNDMIKNMPLSKALEWWENYSLREKAMGVVAPKHFHHPLFEKNYSLLS